MNQDVESNILICCKSNSALDIIEKKLLKYESLQRYLIRLKKLEYVFVLLYIPIILFLINQFKTLQKMPKIKRLSSKKKDHRMHS